MPKKFSGPLVELKRSAQQPHEASMVWSFVSAGFYGETYVTFLFAFLRLTAFFTASEAWLTIFYGMKNNEALKKERMNYWTL